MIKTKLKLIIYGRRHFSNTSSKSNPCGSKFSKKQAHFGFQHKKKFHNSYILKFHEKFNFSMKTLFMQKNEFPFSLAENMSVLQCYLY